MPDPTATATAPDLRSPTELIFKQTLMAAERTWLTWWRSALVATAGALAVGRVTPQALHVAAWPYVTLGAGYGLLAVAMTLIGAGRHRRLKRAARSASDAALEDRTVTAFTAGGTLLALATIALVLAQS